MKRATPILFLFLVIAWVAGPFLYRASWALTGAPVATRTTFPLPKVTPEKARVFGRDTTVATEPTPSWAVPPSSGLYEWPGDKPLSSEARLKKCGLPRPDPNAEIILLGVGSGEALATVSLAHEGMATTVVDLIIEPGDRPLYLVLSSWQNIIWRLEGATDRVSQVGLLAWPRAFAWPGSRKGLQFNVPPPPPRYAGVTGLPAARVVTAQPANCLMVGDLAREDLMETTAARAKSLFGRPAVVMAGGDRASAVRLPSGVAATMQAPAQTTGSVMPAPPATMPESWAEAPDPLSQWPGGLVTVHTSQVASSVAVRPAGLLPGSMGLAQLIEAGDIRRVRRGDRVEYQVHRPIARLPSGMSPWSVFVLEPGVPGPARGDGTDCIRRRTISGLPFTYPVGPRPCMKW